MFGKFGGLHALRSSATDCFVVVKVVETWLWYHVRIVVRKIESDGETRKWEQELMWLRDYVHREEMLPIKFFAIWIFHVTMYLM